MGGCQRCVPVHDSSSEASVGERGALTASASLSLALSWAPICACSHQLASSSIPPHHPHLPLSLRPLPHLPVHPRLPPLNPSSRG